MGILCDGCQACRRLIGEEAQLQAEKWAQSFQHHKEAWLFREFSWPKVSSEVFNSSLAEPRAELKALRRDLWSVTLCSL